MFQVGPRYMQIWCNFDGLWHHYFYVTVHTMNRHPRDQLMGMTSTYILYWSLQFNPLIESWILFFILFYLFLIRNQIRIHCWVILCLTPMALLCSLFCVLSLVSLFLLSFLLIMSTFHNLFLPAFSCDSDCFGFVLLGGARAATASWKHDRWPRASVLILETHILFQ